MIDYQTFMKHAEKVCKNAPEVRPILKGVYHYTNGDAVCTDAHRLYLAKGIHDRHDEAVITPAGIVVDGSYPDVTRIIPSVDPHQTIETSLGEILQATDTIYSIGGIIEETPRMELIDDLIKYDSILVKYRCELSIRFEVPLCLNARYLFEALKLFKAAGCQTLKIAIHGSLRPVVLTNEDKSLLVLILPVRKY